MKSFVAIVTTFIFTFALSPSLAFADMVKMAKDHPWLTGTAVVIGGAAAVEINYKKKCHAAKKGELPGWDASGCGDLGSEPVVTLKDVAQLALLKSQTKELRKNLAANGEAEKKGCAAHHIVPKNEKREWARDSADNARTILNNCNIGLDSSANGIFLPYNEDAECAGANHRNLHTQEYYKLVARLLILASRSGCGAVRQTLGDIKTALRNDAFIRSVR